ncbi:MAG TPA: AMP-binding protein, partial [Candidatus Margulisiibacteriota bacterium]|nr:AMP-binding protein [Candidatus Margulisiibacteriota bacterium]
DPARAARVLLRFNDAQVTHAEYYSESIRWANALRQLRSDGPFHVGVLLDNIPDYFFALGGGALAGAVIAGINNTKRGTHLARDIAYTDCQILVTEEKYLPLLEPVLDETGVAAERVLVTRRWNKGGEPANACFRDLDAILNAWGAGPDPQVTVSDRDPYILVFTSGTVTAPKAIVCSHGRMVETGKNIGANIYAMSPADVGYIAMPLFHANALMCGFLPALYYGAGVGMIRKFSKTRWLSDIRRYGATFFNYTGKPLAYILGTPRQPDDHVNPLRICYGNEGSHRVVAEFEERFGCRVIDVFGSSEGGVGVTRQPGDPPRSIGFPAAGIAVVDAQGNEKPPAQFDDAGRLCNADEAIGEIVNTQGLAWFEGYYKNPEAMQQRTRNGWYWTGDLGYKDQRGYLYFAGRDVEWLRVDGENFVARPVEEILQRHPDVVLAAVYGVPDPDGGDRVMAALLLRDGAVFDSDRFQEFLGAQADLSPKWTPAYIRIASELPQTATSKVLKNELRRQKFRPDLCADPIYWHARSNEPYRRFTAEDYARLHVQFVELSKLSLLDV